MEKGSETTIKKRRCRLLGSRNNPKPSQQDSDVSPRQDDRKANSIPITMEEAALCAMTIQSHISVPEIFKEAMVSDEAEKWRSSFINEINSMKSLRGYNLVDKPPGRKHIDSRWAFRVKTDENGNLIKYKAIWVVK